MAGPPAAGTPSEQGRGADAQEVLAIVSPCFAEMVGLSSPSKGGLPLSAQRVDDAWQIRAGCRGPQASVFFPPPTFERKDEKLAREAQAKEICRTCPVKAPCLEYAIRIKEPHGIWGGLNEAERKQLIAEKVG
jgi:WhiB family transcriptional regulator, redox-sensing transcriptional regulator